MARPGEHHTLPVRSTVRQHHHTYRRKTSHLRALYEQVAKAKNDWQNTFDSISDMICILDNNARITRVNRALRSKLNLPYESIIGSLCYKVMHTSSFPPGTCPLNTVLKTKQPIPRDAKIQIGDSLYDATIYPFFDSTGEMHGTVNIYRDVTEQNKLKDRLVQSEKMAAIGTLAAELAHEINNPLDYINNYLYLLSDSLPPDFPHHEYLKKIERGLDNLAALTRDLLEFSRPHLDAFVPVDMHTVIEGALEFSHRNLTEKRVEVVKEYGCSDRKVTGSERMLQQVLLNLIDNSIDAMPGGGTFIIATSCGQEKFIMECIDTGVGIPEEHLSRIFEPFFTTKKNMEKRGTGLGLTICYNIIHRHHGEIQAASSVGEGAKFTITLPLLNL